MVEPLPEPPLLELLLPELPLPVLPLEDDVEVELLLEDEAVEELEALALDDAEDDVPLDAPELLDAAELLDALELLDVVPPVLELLSVPVEPAVLDPDMVPEAVDAALPEEPELLGWTPAFGQRAGSWPSLTQMKARQV